MEVQRAIRGVIGEALGREIIRLDRMGGMRGRIGKSLVLDTMLTEKRQLIRDLLGCSDYDEDVKANSRYPRRDDDSADGMSGEDDDDEDGMINDDELGPDAEPGECAVQPSSRLHALSSMNNLTDLLRLLRTPIRTTRTRRIRRMELWWRWDR